MRASGTFLCAVPAACWGSQPLSSPGFEALRRMLQELGSVERKLRKNAARDEEEQRYARICGQIEQEALSRADFAPQPDRFATALRRGRFPAIRIGSEYVDLLRQIQLQRRLEAKAKGRLGATVFRPDEVARHAQVFEQICRETGYLHDPAVRHRLWFLTQRIRPNSCGLIEVPDPLSLSRQSESEQVGGEDGRDWSERLWGYLSGLLGETPKPAESSARRLEALRSGQAASPSSSDWQAYHSTARRGEFIQDRLRRQIKEAIADGSPVSVMNQRQNIVTMGLQEFIHVAPGVQPTHIPVMYNDGRLARPFPLQCVPRLPDGWRHTKEFHFALISMRHLPLDQYIDLNWYRNADVPTKEGLAASDENCYQASLRQFTELLAQNAGHRVRIYLYHTGYMPAIVGFYRALVSTVASRASEPACLQVIPALQPDKKTGDFVMGRPWPE